MLAAAGALSATGPLSLRMRATSELGQVEGLRDAALGTTARSSATTLASGYLTASDCTDADWQLLLDVNVTGDNGYGRSCRDSSPRVRGTSTTASLSGLIGDPDLAVYNTAKFAVVGLAEATAHEMVRDHPGISASVLCPGRSRLSIACRQAVGRAASRSTELDEAVDEYLARGKHPVGRTPIEGIAEGRFYSSPPRADLRAARPTPRSDAARRLAEPDDDWTDQQ